MISYNVKPNNIDWMPVLQLRSLLDASIEEDRWTFGLDDLKLSYSFEY